MRFEIGDWVVHCAHGLGQVHAIEEKMNNNKTSLYYEIQLNHFTIWVPADENQDSRLRPPASAAEIHRRLATLSDPADQLSNDRRQRNLELLEMLKDGKFESLCRVLRNLTAYRNRRTWNEYDSALMDRVKKSLIAEWSFVLSVPPHEAETKLHQLLSAK